VKLRMSWRSGCAARSALATGATAMYKARATGDLLINEQRLPGNGFF
jgi:hypothetical protein